MEFTKKFIDSVYQLLDEVNVAYPERDAMFDKFIEMLNAVVYRYKQPNPSCSYHVSIELSDTESLAFSFKCYTDPFLKERTFAHIDETAINLVESLDENEVEKTYTQSGVEAHVVSSVVDKDGTVSYKGLFSDGFGSVSVQTFSSLKEACAYSIGMSTSEIHEALMECYGTLWLEDGEIEQVTPQFNYAKGEYDVVYKDALLFEMCKRGYSSDLPCYIPDTGITFFLNHGEPVSLQFCDMESYESILRQCDNHHHIADYAFYAAENESIVSIYYQLEPTEIAALVADIPIENASDYTFLDYMGEDYWDRPVYQVVGTNTFVKDLDLGKFGQEPNLNWSLPKTDFGGEPDYPFKPDKPVLLVSTNNFELPRNAVKFNTKAMCQDQSIAELANEGHEGQKGIESTSPEKNNYLR